jgi:N-acetylmuramoyl-L-alanine amidase
MEIVTRKGWGARVSRYVDTVSMSSRRRFIVHYSGAPIDQTVRAIQDWCMNDAPHGRGFADIDYNFLVRGSTGEIYQGRGWSAVGAHTKGYNTAGIGVCVISPGPISDAAKASVQWLYAEAVRRAGRQLLVCGHRDLTSTDCPGDEIEHWVKSGAVTAKAAH